MAAPPAKGRVELVAGDGLNEPFGVEFDRAGRTYVVEMGGHRVTVLDGQGGRRVLADDFKGPHHLLMGPDGALYVADTFNYRVRRFDLRTGIATVVAGTGQKGFSGDGGPATGAQFGGIFAIAFRNGALYVCDLDNGVYAPSICARASSRRWPAAARRACRDGTAARRRRWSIRARLLRLKGNLYIASAPATRSGWSIARAGSARSRARGKRLLRRWRPGAGRAGARAQAHLRRS